MPINSSSIEQRNFLLIDLTCAHFFSIGLRSGLYGGRNSGVQPQFSIASSISLRLWNVALFMTITASELTLGSRSCVSHA